MSNWMSYAGAACCGVVGAMIGGTSGIVATVFLVLAIRFYLASQ